MAADSANSIPNIPEFLLNDQREHFLRCHSILMKNTGYMDTSEQGRGKTFIALALAKELGLPLFVVCVANVVSKWEKLAAEKGVKVVYASTYGTLTSTHNTKKGECERLLEHGYLTRKDTFTEGTNGSNGKHKVNFYPTRKLEDLIASGALFVFDEAHLLKNESQRFKAAHAITSIISEGSRYALLTGTPCDMEDQAVRYAKLMGYIIQSKLYHNRNGNITLTGLNDLLNVCKDLDAEQTATVANPTRLQDYHTYNKLVYELMSKIVMPNISSAIPHHRIKTTGGNILIKLGAEKEAQTNAILSKLKKLVLNPDGSAKSMGERNMSQVIPLLTSIETIKCPIFVNTADEALKADPGLKVVIFLNYINKPEGKDRVSNVDEVYNALTALGYEPLVLVGCLDTNTRDWVVNEFQTNPRHRAIIVSMDLGVGIDLHATEKGHSRLVLLSPDYSLIAMEQAKMRVIRQGVDEEKAVRIEIIYLDGKESEMNIMAKLAAKKDNIKGMLDQSNQKTRQFIPDMEVTRRQAV